MTGTKIAFKDSVRLSVQNLQLSQVAILAALQRTAPPLYADAIVITSACDGVHGAGSLHPRGRAFDVRVYGARPRGIRAIAGATFTTEQEVRARAWVSRLRAELGADYDVILESDHIHIEYDPK